MNKNAKQNLKKDLGLWTKGFKSGVKMIVPTSPSDVAWMAGGYGASRVVGGIVKKGSKYVAKAYRNMGSK